MSSASWMLRHGGASVATRQSGHTAGLSLLLLLPLQSGRHAAHTVWPHARHHGSCRPVGVSASRHTRHRASGSTSGIVRSFTFCKKRKRCT